MAPTIVSPLSPTSCPHHPHYCTMVFFASHHLSFPCSSVRVFSGWFLGLCHGLMAFPRPSHPLGPFGVSSLSRSCVALASENSPTKNRNKNSVPWARLPRVSGSHSSLSGLVSCSSAAEWLVAFVVFSACLWSLKGVGQMMQSARKRLSKTVRSLLTMFCPRAL